MVIPFSHTGIIILPSNFILSPVTIRAVLLVIFIIGLFNFLQVCKFIIDKSEPESNWNLTDLFCTLTVMYLRMTLSDLSSLFVCLTLFLIIFLFLYLCPNLLQFWHFLYDRDSPSLNVIFHSGSKCWVIFFGWHLSACIEILGNHIFFSLLPESMIGIYAWLSLRKQHQTPRYFLSLSWHSLSSDSLQPVFEVWDWVCSLISTKLCVWFPCLLPTLGLVRISDIWSYPLTIRLV